eukprot:SAG22_NODE_5010_length_1109_cov_1.198020_1_plen_159_part_10
MRRVEALRKENVPPTRRRSFGVFGDQSCIRLACDRLAKSEAFEHWVIGAILVSSLLLAIEHPNDLPGGTKATVLQACDVALTGFFVTEMLVKMISAGVFWGSNRAHLRSGFNVLDFTVVGISVSNLVLAEAGVKSSAVKYLRVMRTLRVLRAIQHLKRW